MKRQAKHKSPAEKIQRTLAPEWQVQTAKARFSELFRLTREEGAQLITKQGKEGVVMLPLEQYEQLISRATQPASLLKFFRSSPLVGLEMKIERDKDAGREIEL